jgi:hypothetical protein
MTKKQEELLRALRFELEFLRHGGYGRSVRTPWQSTSVFQDSPTCLNFDEVGRPHPCDECMLMQFVPAEHRQDEIPCHQIPLNEKGDTIETLFEIKRSGMAEDLLEKWLVDAIARVEAQSAVPTAAGK